MLTKKDFLYYIDKGISVTGVHEIKKKWSKKDNKFKKDVTFYNWKHLQENYATDEQIDEWVKKKGKAIALITGKLSGIVVVDIDEENQDKYPYLQSSPLVIATPTNKGFHYYFKYTDKLDKFGPAVTLDDLPMDYRGTGGLVFLPKSDIWGKTYKIVKGSFDDLSELPELPDEVFKALRDKKNYEGESYLKKERGLIQLPKLSEGERNQETTRVIGSILSKMPMEQWEAFAWPGFEQWNETMVEPPQPVAALRDTFDQIAQNESRKRSLELIPEIYRSSFYDLAREALLREDEGFFTTGYKDIDIALEGGLKYRNAYLVSGLDKSGKSSWLMKVLQMKMDEGIKIGFLNTELPIEEFLQRMTAQHLEKGIRDVTKKEMRTWNKKFKGKFEYIGAEQLSKSTNDEVEISIKEMMEKGIECLVFDNITTRGTMIEDGKAGYQMIAEMLQKVVTITKQYKVVTFAVIHTKQNIVISIEKAPSLKGIDDRGGVRKIMHQNNTPFVRRPVLGDIYGGGQALSQVSGTIFIYRPFQKFDEPEYSKVAGVILESMRHCPTTIVDMVFYGEKGLFADYSEDYSPEVMKEKFLK